MINSPSNEQYSTINSTEPAKWQWNCSNIIMFFANAKWPCKFPTSPLGKLQKNYKVGLKIILSYNNYLFDVLTDSFMLGYSSWLLNNKQLFQLRSLLYLSCFKSKLVGLLIKQQSVGLSTGLIHLAKNICHTIITCLTSWRTLFVLGYSSRDLWTFPASFSLYVSGKFLLNIGLLIKQQSLACLSTGLIHLATSMVCIRL